MSGRIKTKRDGAWITGHRKTDRRNPRRRRDDAKTLSSIVFELPSALAWSTSPGKYGYFITVDGAGQVTVTSYGGAAHLRRIAQRFVQKIAAGQVIDMPAIRMTATPAAAPR